MRRTGQYTGQKALNTLSMSILACHFLSYRALQHLGSLSQASEEHQMQSSGISCVLSQRRLLPRDWCVFFPQGNGQCFQKSHDFDREVTLKKAHVLKRFDIGSRCGSIVAPKSAPNSISNSCGYLAFTLLEEKCQIYNAYALPAGLVGRSITFFHLPANIL